MANVRRTTLRALRMDTIFDEWNTLLPVDIESIGLADILGVGTLSNISGVPTPDPLSGTCIQFDALNEADKNTLEMGMRSLNTAQLSSFERRLRTFAASLQLQNTQPSLNSRLPIIVSNRIFERKVGDPRIIERNSLQLQGFRGLWIVI
jgi:hypothetical protein